MTISSIKGIFFPLINIYEMFSTKEIERKQPELKGVGGIDVHISAHSGGIPKLILATIFFQFSDIENCKEFRFDWISKILIRDIIISVLFSAFWDYIEQKSFVQNKLKVVKFNPVYPTQQQILHDFFWTIISTLISSLFEIVLFYLWANNKLQYSKSFDNVTIIFIVLMPYVRILHFYLIHRGMHPWNTTKIPDIGKFLYQHVHKLHHKSYNPSALSGISMHPIESTLYYTAAMIPALFYTHPIIFMFYKFDLTIAAQAGHDGHGAPGTASYQHYLHHALFEYNYGENYLPIDWLFGNFIDHDPRKVDKVN